MPSTIETRKTYRAVLSEPKLVVSHGDCVTHATHGETEVTPLPLPITSTYRLKLFDLASHSSTIKIDKSNKKRKRESLLK